MGMTEPRSVERNYSPQAAPKGSHPPGFNKERAHAYSVAAAAVPEARSSEAHLVQRTLESLNICNARSIVELGAGQGFATSILCQYLDSNGVIFAVDASEEMISHMPNLPTVQHHVGHIENIGLEEKSVDLVFSLAAFHHIPNKYQVLREAFRVLKVGGAVVLIDVQHGTEAQRIFDYIVRPYCSSGHEADFLDADWIQLLCNRVGFKVQSSVVEECNWEFTDTQSKLDYIKSIFCIDLSDESLCSLLQEHGRQDPRPGNGKVYLPWSLGVHVLRK